jgi:hypothetical protein
MAEGGHTRTRLVGRRATGGNTTAVASAEQVAWLVTDLRAVVATNPQDRRRVRLTITARAKPVVGDIDLGTARHLQTVLNGMSPQACHHLFDVLRDTLRRSPGCQRNALVVRTFLALRNIYREVSRNGQRGRHRSI